MSTIGPVLAIGFWSAVVLGVTIGLSYDVRDWARRRRQRRRQQRTLSHGEVSIVLYPSRRRIVVAEHKSRPRAVPAAGAETNHGGEVHDQYQ